MKIKKGDTVRVISGKDRGKEGNVIKTYPKTNRVLVEGINMVKRNQKPTQANPDGGILEFEAPIHASNAMIVEGKDVTRVGHKVVQEQTKKETIERKVRVSKKTGEVLD